MDPIENSLSKDEATSYLGIDLDNPYFSKAKSLVDFGQRVFKASMLEFITVHKGELPPLEGKKVTIVLQANGGYGDILFAQKAAITLQKKGCHVTIAILPGQEYSQDKVKKILEESNLTHITLVACSDPESKHLDTDCVIIAPIRPNEDVLKHHFPTLLNKPSRVIHEYGLIKDKSNKLENFGEIPISAGLGEGQLGIFTENGLIGQITEGEKVGKLKSLDEHFGLLKGETPEQYLSSTELFFGYAHKSQSMNKFVSTVALSQKEELDKNIDIVLPWRDTYIQKAEFSDQCTYVEKDLKEAGIGKVETINNKGVVTTKMISEDGEGKTLRIISPFPLPKEQILDLLDVSNDLTLATGDQSWNENILRTSKIILYEKMPWKIDFYATVKKISKKQPLVKEVICSWDDNAPVKKITEALKNLSSDRSQITDFHKSIVSLDHSLEKSLEGEAQLLSALGQSPQLMNQYSIITSALDQAFLLPSLIQKSRFSLGTFLAVFVHGYSNVSDLTKEFGSTIDFYKGHFEKQKANVPEEIETLLTKAFLLYENIKAGVETPKAEIAKTIRALYSLESKLILLAQAHLKERAKG